MESSCNIIGIFGSPVAYCCQSFPFSEWYLKFLNVHKLNFKMALGLTIIGSIAATTLRFKIKSWK